MKAEELQMVRKQEMMDLMKRALQDDAIFHNAVGKQLETSTAVAKDMKKR